MIWLTLFILAVVQGLTEFLPVSSSGHIVVFDSFLRVLGLSGKSEHGILLTNIVLHAGSLLTILVYYRERIVRLLSSDRRLIWLLFIGSIPAGVVGLTLKRCTPSLLESPVLTGFMFFVTAGLLVFASRRPAGSRTLREMTWVDALLIGLLQAPALLPGISRSGSTICAGLFRGLDREESAAFSFLLAIPAIGGGLLLEMKDLFASDEAIRVGDFLPLGFGLIVSFLVGLLALRWLIGWLRGGRLEYFAWYLVGLGVLVIASHIS